MSLFETDRLTARRLTSADLDAMFAIYGDLETVRFVGDSIPITHDDCRKWIELTDKNFQHRGYGMIAFCDKTSGEILGCGGMVHPGHQIQAEVKYAFVREQWGKGFATEAITGLIRYAREVWEVGSIIATVFPDNQSSQHVLSKLGFTRSEDRINEDASITQIWVLEA